MPARLMAMTQGDALAFEAVPRRGSFCRVMIEMTKVPRM